MTRPKTKKKTPSLRMRQQLRAKIQSRIANLGLSGNDAAARMGLTPSQFSRLSNDYNVLSLDRLVDVAQGIGLTVELRAVRPYAK